MVNEALLELPGDLVEVDVGVARVIGDAEQDDVDNQYDESTEDDETYEDETYDYADED